MRHTQPLAAFEVAWTPPDEPTATGGDRLPPVLALAGGLPFSGRADAFGELVELAKHCSHDAFALALVAGEPGEHVVAEVLEVGAGVGADLR